MQEKQEGREVFGFQKNQISLAEVWFAGETERYTKFWNIEESNRFVSG